MAKRPPRPGEGRPTKYKPEYCQMLIDHMEKGLSFESFAGTINACDDTLRNWANRYPEFFNARKEGYAKNRAFWEKLGMAGLTGKIAGFNASVWIFNMKNRFKWTDRQETTHAGNVELMAPTVVFKIDDDETNSN